MLFCSNVTISRLLHSPTKSKFSTENDQSHTTSNRIFNSDIIFKNASRILFFLPSELFDYFLLLVKNQVHIFLIFSLSHIFSVTKRRFTEIKIWGRDAHLLQMQILHKRQKELHISDSVTEMQRMISFSFFFLSLSFFSKTQKNSLTPKTTKRQRKKSKKKKTMTWRDVAFMRE